ncbi:endospore germination permease [Paenibacillus sp. GCM10027626]|uniref:endospore germination permease n=1 Tax=Paenibacillus sp. GCM10027626 TaxID=3273411 RepID=UPI0036325E82
MINTNAKIGFLQIFMVMMLFNGLLSHVIVNPMLLDASGRDAWISVLLTAAIYIPWCVILIYIMHKSGGQKLQPWLAEQTNPLISWILLLPVAVHLYLIGGMTITQTTIWTISNYLPATPQSLLILVLVAVCFYAAIAGLNTITVGAGILLPVVVVLGYLVSFANMPHKDWMLLKPFLENGWKPAINGMVYAGGAFVEIFLLLLLQHRVKKKIKAWQIILLGLVLVYITLGPIVGAITEFGPSEAAKQMVSPYEQWRLVKLGNHIEHVDFLSVFQWLAGATVRISLAQFLLADLFPFRKRHSRNWFIFAVSISYIVLAISSIYFNSFYLGIFEKYLTISLFVTLILTFVWFVIACLAKPARREHNER